jgi:hypothetical protein
MSDDEQTDYPLPPEWDLMDEDKRSAWMEAYRSYMQARAQDTRFGRAARALDEEVEDTDV